MLPLTHQQVKKKIRNFADTRKDIEIIFLLQNIDSPANVGHFFRLADAVGAKEIVLTGKTPSPDNEEVKITSMNNETRIKYSHFTEYQEAIKYVRENGFKIISLELTESSMLYTELPFIDKICIVAGNETSGVYPYVLKNSDYVVHIPMYGKNFSLNVHVAAAIVTYNILLNERI